MLVKKKKDIEKVTFKTNLLSKEDVVCKLGSELDSTSPHSHSASSYNTSICCVNEKQEITAFRLNSQFCMSVFEPN